MENKYKYLIFGFQKDQDGQKGTSFLKTPDELDPAVISYFLQTSDSFSKNAWAFYDAKDGKEMYVRLFDVSSLITSPEYLSYFKDSVSRTCSVYPCAPVSEPARIRLSAFMQPVLDAQISNSSCTVYYDITRGQSFREENKQYLSDLAEILSNLDLLKVERERLSVTQGSAVVYCNGHHLCRFGDDIYLEQNNGKFSNGFHEKEGQHYGPVISGWGSIKPDKQFLEGAIVQFAPLVLRSLQRPSHAEALETARAFIQKHNIDLYHMHGNVGDHLSENKELLVEQNFGSGKWEFSTKDGVSGTFTSDELMGKTMHKPLAAQISNAKERTSDTEKSSLSGKEMSL